MKKNITSNKLSIDLQDESKTILEQLRVSTLKPFGQIINKLLCSVCNMPKSTREVIQTSLEQEYFRLDEELDGINGAYFSDDYKFRQNHILELLQLINGGIYTLPSPPHKMKEIMLADGRLVIPKDWVLTNEEQASHCHNAVVIECRGGSQYHVPHFIYFFDGKSANDLTEQQEKEFYEKCIEKFPDFKEILRLSDENKLISDPSNPARYLNADAYMNAPKVGIFYINDLGNTFSGNPPYGAVIIRDHH